MERTKTKVTCEQYEQCEYDGYWLSECPSCGSENPTEPDAEEICCQECDEMYSVPQLV